MYIFSAPLHNVVRSVLQVPLTKIYFLPTFYTYSSVSRAYITGVTCQSGAAAEYHWYLKRNGKYIKFTFILDCFPNDRGSRAPLQLASAEVSYIELLQFSFLHKSYDFWRDEKLQNAEVFEDSKEQSFNPQMSLPDYKKTLLLSPMLFYIVFIN